MARKKKFNLNEVDTSEHPEDDGVLSPGPGKESFKLASFWKSQIEMVDQANSKWLKRGNMVIKRYRDERVRLDEDYSTRKMNLLWANTKVMKPAIYSKCPTPVVDRKFLDRDPTGRLSSQMLERSLINELPNGFHSAMTKAVMDRLLPGRGVVWPRYEPKFGSGPSIPAANANGIEDPLAKIGEETGDESLVEDSDKEEELEDTGEQVVAEKVVTDYVDWRDIKLFPAKARTWEEVQAVGKLVHISKKEAKERFGDKIGSSMEPDTTVMSSANSERQPYSDTAIFQDINERSIVVYEIWNKSDLKVYWVSTGYEYLCDVKEDPLELESFFPIPPPLFSTVTNDSLIPIPDFCEWQDQAIQIDELTQRIAMLSKACKIAGAYDASSPAIGRILNETIENKLVPVDQWAMFADKGGLKGVIDFLPLDEIQSCITALQTVRQQCMIDLDQITGLSDIMRGTSDSRETLGGIRLKNNNAGTRLSDSQEEVARFARDTINIIAEIISKHFDDQTIIDSSGILFEEELQPDVIMRDYLSMQPAQQPQQPSMPQAAPHTMQQQAMGGTPSPMPAPGPQAGAPMMAGPQAQPQPMGAGSRSMPPQMGNNVVPFPGGQGPGMGAGPQPPMPIASQLPPDPQVLGYKKIQKAIALLRKDVTRNYRIGIETDSTIFGDRVQERQDATGFVGAVGGFMKQFETIATAVPEAMPLLGKMLEWAVRKYRTGRDLESEVSSFVRAMEKKAKQQADNPQPSKEEVEAQARQAEIKQQADAQAANDARDAQRQAADDQRQFQLQQAEDQRKAQMDASEDDRANQKAALDLQIERQKASMQLLEMQREAEYKAQEHTQNMEELKEKAKENEAKRAEQKRKDKQPKKA